MNFPTVFRRHLLRQVLSCSASKTDKSSAHGEVGSTNQRVYIGFTRPAAGTKKAAMPRKSEDLDTSILEEIAQIGYDLQEQVKRANEGMFYNVKRSAFVSGHMRTMSGVIDDQEFFWEYVEIVEFWLLSGVVLAHILYELSLLVVVTSKAKLRCHCDYVSIGVVNFEEAL